MFETFLGLVVAGGLVYFIVLKYKASKAKKAAESGGERRIEERRSDYPAVK